MIFIMSKIKTPHDVIIPSPFCWAFLFPFSFPLPFRITSIEIFYIAVDTCQTQLGWGNVEELSWDIGSIKVLERGAWADPGGYTKVS